MQAVAKVTSLANDLILRLDANLSKREVIQKFKAFVEKMKGYYEYSARKKINRWKDEGLHNNPTLSRLIISTSNCYYESQQAPGRRSQGIEI